MAAVKFIPMTEGDFQEFITWAAEDYASQQVRAGAWGEEGALEQARKMLGELLPKGQDSPGQFLFVIESQEHEPVGFLWFGLREDGQAQAAVLYELVIFEEHRRNGYASGAMVALEVLVRAKGLHQILLHVFGHNDPARSLYRKMGYAERNITLVKDLDR